MCKGVHHESFGFDGVDGDGVGLGGPDGVEGSIFIVSGVPLYG
jgi:hypothetical protein